MFFTNANGTSRADKATDCAALITFWETLLANHKEDESRLLLPFLLKVFNTVMTTERIAQLNAAASQRIKDRLKSFSSALIKITVPRFVFLSTKPKPKPEPTTTVTDRSQNASSPPASRCGKSSGKAERDPAPRTAPRPQQVATLVASDTDSRQTPIGTHAGQEGDATNASETTPLLEQANPATTASQTSLFTNPKSRGFFIGSGCGLSVAGFTASIILLSTTGVLAATTLGISLAILLVGVAITLLVAGIGSHCAHKDTENSQSVAHT